MLLRSALVTIFALPALISGNQIPVVEGVLGGVPSADARNSSFKTGSGDSSACTPGKLRGVVENSCICGGDLSLLRSPCHIHSFGRGYARCLSGLRIW
jgi:hypothetical protein